MYMPMNSWEDLNQKYGVKPEETKAQEKKSSKVKFALILFFILIIAFVYYQFWIVPEKENSALIGWMDEMQGSSDASLERSKADVAEREGNITRDFELCENDGICDIKNTFPNLNMLYLSKSARYSLENPKIIVDWHRNIINQKSGFGCDSVAKPIALTLSMMFSVSEAGQGYLELNNRQTKAQSELAEAFMAQDLKNDTGSVKSVMGNYSEMRKSYLKAYYEEINQNYSVAKDSQFAYLSKIVLEGYKKDKGGAGINLPVICSDSVISQYLSYQKGFIEYSYGQFNSLVNSGTYEEAIPFANTLYGFMQYGKYSSGNDNSQFG